MPTPAVMSVVSWCSCCRRLPGSRLSLRSISPVGLFSPKISRSFRSFAGSLAELQSLSTCTHAWECDFVRGVAQSYNALIVVVGKSCLTRRLPMSLTASFQNKGFRRLFQTRLYPRRDSSEFPAFSLTPPLSRWARAGVRPPRVGGSTAGRRRRAVNPLNQRERTHGPPTAAISASEPERELLVWSPGFSRRDVLPAKAGTPNWRFMGRAKESGHLRLCIAPRRRTPAQIGRARLSQRAGWASVHRSGALGTDAPYLVGPRASVRRRASPGGSLPRLSHAEPLP